MYNLVVEKRAQKEFEDSYRYYMSFVSEKVAKDFLLEYESALKKILSLPEMYTNFNLKYKKYVFKKFKHVLYYYLDKNKIIVIAILHQSREVNNVISKMV